MIPTQAGHFQDQVAVVTGGGGVLCSALCKGLAAAGARVVVLDLRADPAEAVALEIQAAGGQSLALACDVLRRDSLEQALQRVLAAYGRVDLLVNGAGGNHPQATTGAQAGFFDLPVEAARWVFELNFIGALLACQVFGRQMARQGSGAILNISSMNAYRPLTRVPAYSAAKAALSNFTQWLAVYMAQEVSVHIRVNALAPGFFQTGQNRYLLTDAESGQLTPRGRQILDHTPLGRFGAPEDLIGAALWLLSPEAAFVTGVVVPVDGGFSAFSGV